MRKLSLLVVFLSFYSLLPAQQSVIQAELLRKLEILRNEKESRVARYLKSNSSRNRLGEDFLLVDVTPGGIPIYKAPINVNAALTTGVTRLQSGQLGINLEGKGMVVGIWDGGKVDQHPELDPRIIFREEAAVSFHATHVTGTILAKGINTSAKGMAPMAQARTYTLANDFVEMTTEAVKDNGLVISNHSYGTVTGWLWLGDRWQWLGDPDISDREDYKFGLYRGDSEAMDKIAYLAPYYTIVQAAGNDGADVGDGMYPGDGAEDEGYDMLIQEAVAKNNIVVGAVNPVTNYTDPSSVSLAWFSSTGPTDDGRIKPDLVADGVDVYSTGTGNGYWWSTGTSMATPNVTGSLTLLQELHKKLHGNKVMRASTLKALAIHTTKEAGAHPGPDYRFGWGLLDVELAAKILVEEDQVNIVVEERVLHNNETITFPLEPVAGKKITVTLAWTDPAATPPGHLLDPETPMLINDLDIRLVDGDNTIIFPWVLDKNNPALAATRGNNVVDNVEKIEFDLPEDKLYNLVVSHKGILVDPQHFSLIVSHTSKLAVRTFYWIGGTGEWPNGANWALTTGGPPAFEVPGPADNIIIDDHAFSGATEEGINMPDDVTCRSFRWLTDKHGVLSMNGNTMKISEELTISSGYFYTMPGGVFAFEGEGNVNIQGPYLENYTLTVIGGNSKINGSLLAARLRANQGTITFDTDNLFLSQLIAAKDATLDITGKKVEGLEVVSLDNTSVLAENATLFVAQPAVFDMQAIDFEGTVNILSDGALYLFGDSELDSLSIQGIARIYGANSFSHFHAYPGAVIDLEADKTQRIENIALTSINENAIVELRSMTNANATIEYTNNEKRCFDYLRVVDVDLISNSVFNVGLNSEVLDSDGWLAMLCEDVLFADFTISYACDHGITHFTDKSEGPIVSWTWDFGDPSSGSNTFDGQHAKHRYMSPGVYPVTVTIASAGYAYVLNREIEIQPNTIVNTIAQNNFVLKSDHVAETYQWYRNDEALEDEDERTYTFDGPGSYSVLTTSGSCNHLADPHIVLGEEEYRSFAAIVYPNPAQDKIFIHFKIPRLRHSLAMIDAMGRRVSGADVDTDDTVLDVAGLRDGIYILDVDGEKIKVILQR